MTPNGWELLTAAHPCPYKGVGDPSPLSVARCPVNTYRLLITGPRTGRRVDTVPAASLQAAVAMLQQQARLFDSAAEVAPLHDPCPFG